MVSGTGNRSVVNMFINNYLLNPLLSDTVVRIACCCLNYICEVDSVTKELNF